MSTIDDFSRLVSGIYAAVMTPDQWNVTLADIGRAFDGSRAALVIADGNTRIHTHADLPADTAQSYAEHYARLDHVLAAVETGPLGAVRTGAELMWPHQNCEFQADWARPNGFVDGMFIRLTGAPSTMSLAVAASKRSDRFDTAERVALMLCLVPHLQQALRTQDRLEDLSHQGNGLVEASEAVIHGIVIVRPGGRVVYTNSAADRILHSDDGLQIRGGILEAAMLRTDLLLQRSIGRAFTPDSFEICGGSLFCVRPSGRRPFVIHVLPIDQTTFASPQSGRAIIVIVDPEQHPEPPAALLRRLYGLTKSEAQIALFVTRGEGLKPIADELSLSVTTVKTHLRHVFDKTGTHRQAELVRLLLTIDPVSRQAGHR